LENHGRGGLKRPIPYTLRGRGNGRLNRKKNKKKKKKKGVSLKLFPGGKKGQMLFELAAPNKGNGKKKTPYDGIKKKKKKKQRKRPKWGGEKDGETAEKKGAISIGGKRGSHPKKPSPRYKRFQWEVTLGRGCFGFEKISKRGGGEKRIDFPGQERSLGRRTKT